MKEKSPFSLSQPRSYKEIMEKSSRSVDNYTLGLQFPSCDFGSYYLYAAMIGDGPCQAINLGITIGHDSGKEVNIPQLKGDPGGVWIVTSLICNKKSYRSFDFSTYRRADVIYSRQELDLEVGDTASIKGRWPYFEIYLKDKDYNITYEISGRAGYAHWVPDHVSTSMAYSYLLFPDFTFTGKITVRDEIYDIKGIGSLDHVFGRNINNPGGMTIGFWHADPIAWEDKYVSNGLFYIDAEGKPYITGGIMTLPDGGYHPAHNFQVKYLDFARTASYSGRESDFQLSPRKWRARMEAEHGVLTYETQPLAVFNPQNGEELIEPCVLSDVRGIFHGKDGTVLSLKGKCYNEFEAGILDPSKF